MKPLLNILTVISICFVTSCATPTPTPAKYTWVPRVKFDEKEYEPYAKAGKNKVKAQGLLRTQGGDVKFSAGNQVILSPVTSYSTQFVETMVKGTRGDKTGLREKPDERIKKYYQSGTCDGTGTYVFENVPDGEYYIYTHVDWSTGESFAQSQGGWVYKKITVKEPFTENTIVINTVGRDALSYLLLRQAGQKEKIPLFRD